MGERNGDEKKSKDHSPKEGQSGEEGAHVGSGLSSQRGKNRKGRRFQVFEAGQESIKVCKDHCCFNSFLFQMA